MSATVSSRAASTAGSFGARRKFVDLLIAIAVLAVMVCVSLAVGANPLGPGELWGVLTGKGGSEASSVVLGLRAPRTAVGIVAGAAFGVAGALIQSLTRNPLADPGILGVNAGAGFAVTLGVGLLGLTSITGYIWFALVGAAISTLLVYLIGSTGRGTVLPVTLVLAGVALGAVLTGLSAFLTLIDPGTFQAIRSWGLGSVAKASLSDVTMVLPFILAGLGIAFALSGSLNSIALGEDIAASLGTKVQRVRTLGVVAITLLAGTATALTGGLSFVGLMVPHIVRWFVGPDQRWIIIQSAVMAPILVVAADVIGRVVAMPGEVQAGVVTAVLGAPVLIALVRRQRVSAL